MQVAIQKKKHTGMRIKINQYLLENAITHVPSGFCINRYSYSMFLLAG